MNRIHMLDDNISMRIAAGEVVINPASVIKELVENSIDANSTSITVEITGGGVESIKVTDNGDGIHPDDIYNSLQKHCTSKISKLEDIHKISTLGFRGEALASISAVSNIEIRSQAIGMGEGRTIKNFGLESFKPAVAGLPYGTTVIVKNLFYNTPARRKYLKSTQRETALITDLMSKLILSRPDISFTYLNNGKIIYKSAGNGSLIDCIRIIYGNDIVSSLREVNSSSSICTIKGYISNASILYKTRKNIIFFVNNRYIQSRTFQETLLSAYSERLLRGHFPISIINIDIEPELVDVNVHPSKTTILCNEEKAIDEFIYNTIKSVLDTKDYPVYDYSAEIYNEKLLTLSDIKANLSDFPSSDTVKYSPDETQSKHDYTLPESTDFIDALKDLHNETEFNRNEEDQVNSLYDDFIDYRIIGNAFNTYIIVQANDRLLIIDQHAAHERLNYEELKRNETISSRILLVPQVINLSADEHDELMNNNEILSGIGFDISDFGGTSVKISAIPNHIKEDSARVLIDDFLYELKTSRHDIKVLRDKIIRKSCRMSIKGGDPLSEEEIKVLIDEIINSEVMPTCPHGRPIAVAFTKDYIEKQFKRIV